MGVLTHTHHRLVRNEKMILEEETYETYGYYPKDISHGSHKKILVSCDNCGGIRIVSLWNYNKSKTKLCTSCALKHPHPNFKGKNNPRWQERIYNCEQCGKLIDRCKKQIERREHHFCSLACGREWHKTGMTKKCEICGKEIYVKESRKDTQRFCSTKCMGEWQSKNTKGENSPSWKGGISFEPYCAKFNNRFEEAIRDKFDRKCFICGVFENGKKHCVHHVNYDKGCLCNNNISCQFVPLCHSCHSKTNANREFWQNLIMTKLRQRIDGYCF